MQPIRTAPLSRETRLLLLTIVLSVGALWALARIRFAERPANPITPVLTQLAPPPVFDQLISAVGEVQARLAPRMIGIATDSSSGPHLAAALRIDTQTAVAILGDATINDGADIAPVVDVIARDPASGLAVLRLVAAEPADVTRPELWSPRQAQSARYLIAADVSPAGVSARPIFVSALEPMVSPVWSAVVWKLPTHVDVSPGSFVFTMDGALAGLTADVGSGLTLVPGSVIDEAVERLRREPVREYGRLGVEVQALTSSVASAAQAQFGVIVTAVDPQGPAAADLIATDVVEAMDEVPITTYEHWRARVDRLSVGEQIAVRVRRQDVVRTVTLQVAPRSDRPAPLGLSLRLLRRRGAEVLNVAPASAAARAGLRSGDIITRVNGRAAPTPADVTRAFTGTTGDRPILIAVTRGATHHVLAVPKR